MLSGLAKMWYLLSSDNLTRIPDMPWNETTKTKYTRPRDRFESDLTDEEWNLVKPCLPPPAKRGRPRKTDLREVADAIQFVLATGCQWRAIPLCFPKATTVQYYLLLLSENSPKALK